MENNELVEELLVSVEAVVRRYVAADETAFTEISNAVYTALMQSTDIGTAAAIMGRRKSLKKASSSRENGKRGGRPKKINE